MKHHWERFFFFLNVMGDFKQNTNRKDIVEDKFKKTLRKKQIPFIC